MTIRAFWILLIKVIGIWFLFESLSVLGEFITTMLSFLEEPDIIITWIILTLITILLYFGALLLFVFRAEWLVNVLKLEKGIKEERIELSSNQEQLLRLATIIIGGLLIILSFPDFCRELFHFMQFKVILRESPSLVPLVFLIVKTIIGFLMMTNGDRIARFIDKKSKMDEPLD